MDKDSVASQMNRGLFLAPDLDVDEDEDPLLAQLREDVDDEAEHAKEVEDHKLGRTLKHRPE